MKKALSDDILDIAAIFDIRAETLAANLLTRESGNENFGIDQIIISPIGSARRRVAEDVAEIKRKYYEGQDNALMIEINRKGLFDTLPERLFIKLEKEYDTPKKRTKAIERQIKDARKFFLPFEQAMYHPRIETERLEEKWTEGFPDFIHRIWGLNEFGKALDDRQKFLLCYLIPEAYRVVGNWKLTSLCFKAVLKKPVKLTFAKPLTLENPNGDIPANELVLGENAVMGTHFQDDIPSLEVEVSEVTLDELPDYLEGGDSLKVLEDLLYSYFLPLDVTVVTKIKVTEDAWGFTFGETYLNYNTQI